MTGSQHAHSSSPARSFRPSPTRSVQESVSSSSSPSTRSARDAPTLYRQIQDSLTATEFQRFAMVFLMSVFMSLAYRRFQCGEKVCGRDYCCDQRISEGSKLIQPDEDAHIHSNGRKVEGGAIKFTFLQL